MARCPLCQATLEIAEVLPHLLSCAGAVPGSTYVIPLVIHVTPLTASPTVILAEGIEFSQQLLQLRIGEVVHQLTAMEARLLTFLIAHPRQVLTRSSIFEAVWGFDSIAGEREVDHYVHRLRKRFSTAGAARPAITTVRGIGYRLDPWEGNVDGITREIDRGARLAMHTLLRRPATPSRQPDDISRVLGAGES